MDDNAIINAKLWAPVCDDPVLRQATMNTTRLEMRNVFFDSSLGMLISSDQGYANYQLLLLSTTLFTKCKIDIKLKFSIVIVL